MLLVKNYHMVIHISYFTFNEFHKKKFKFHKLNCPCLNKNRSCNINFYKVISLLLLKIDVMMTQTILKKNKFLNNVLEIFCLHIYL